MKAKGCLALVSILALAMAGSGTIHAQAHSSAPRDEITKAQLPNLSAEPPVFVLKANPEVYAQAVTVADSSITSNQVPNYDTPAEVVVDVQDHVANKPARGDPPETWVNWLYGVIGTGLGAVLMALRLRKRKR